MDKKTEEKLDEINLLWIFKQISLGNIVRGALYLEKMFNSVKTCFLDSIKEAEEKYCCCTETEPETKFEPDEAKTVPKKTNKRKSKKKTGKTFPEIAKEEKGDNELQ